MARPLTLLLTLLLGMAASSTLLAQHYFPPVEWSRCYGSSENEEAIDIQTTTDGGFLVLGKSAATDGDLINAPFGSKTWLFRLNADGDLVWQRYFLNGGAPGNLVVTNDGGCILGGRQFTKLDANGSIEWQKPYPSKYVLQTLDGGYALQSTNTFYQNSLVIITKLNEVGDMVWSANVAGTDSFWRSYQVNTRFIEAADSSILVSGGEREVEIPESYFTWMAKIRPDGTQTKKNMYRFAEFRVDPVGKYIGTVNSITPRLIRCDSTLFWNNPIHFTVTGDLELNMDATTVVCGWKAAGHDSLSNGTITKRHKDGDSLVAVMHGGSRNDKFTRIALTLDTGYIALGLTNSNDGDVTGNHGKFDIWVVKFRQDTSVHPLPPPVITSVNEVAAIDNITVYPNPTQGQVHINLPAGYHDATLTVRNITGQLLQTRTAGDRHTTLSLAGQPQGIYFLEVKKNAQRKTFRIVLN
ncbi:MAG: T9SS type A sorting domain-containing protein [Flavipsychrobacter sp.]|nr:T9SS type A sorting domain-containing protein [Flavipsychrobacter sp.]